jgi:hypothetical protein
MTSSSNSFWPQHIPCFGGGKRYLYPDGCFDIRSVHPVASVIPIVIVGSDQNPLFLTGNCSWTSRT